MVNKHIHKEIGERTSSDKAFMKTEILLFSIIDNVTVCFVAFA